ncbi:MAG: AMP-binding protein [Lachnospiraceae bacterium]|nr:AMP-binding protein [Lachnospiraceae bacterium]
MSDMKVRNINERYVEETYDENGVLKTFKLNYPDNFNFAYDVVDDIATHTPERMAMVWCNPQGEEHSFTFADMKKYSDKTANYFRSLGIEKGDMVMVVLKRHYEFWFVATALHKLGAVLVPATFMLTAHDAEYRLNAASIKAVVCTGQGEVAEEIEKAEPKCPTLQLKIIVNGNREGWLDYASGMEAASEEFSRVPTNVLEPLLMYFSSGTSGYPKMVLHNHTYSLAHILTAKHWHTVDPDGIHFTIADTGWGKAVWGKFYGQWIMEGAVFTYDYDKFNANEILTLIGKYKITSLCCPPTMFRMLLSEDIEKYDLSSIKYTTTAGESLNKDVFYKWLSVTGMKIMEGFGQTETTLAICNLRGTDPRPGSLGKPSPLYDVHLLDANGKECLPGVKGEICLGLKNGHQEGLLDCYYLDEEKTKAAMHDGFYHTGDTAIIDEEGYYWYVGRNDDIIKSSGYRIGPFEIEEVLLEHPAVADCAVTGVPDSVRGQIVKATIVLSKDYSASDELKAEIQEFVKHRTAPYKYPRMVSFVHSLPRTVNGKVRRVEIREKDLKSVI